MNRKLEKFIGMQILLLGICAFIAGMILAIAYLKFWAIPIIVVAGTTIISLMYAFDDSY